LKLGPEFLKKKLSTWWLYRFKTTKLTNQKPVGGDTGFKPLI
jgi:hypothetical protein